jgi:hypothetical protein
LLVRGCLAAAISARLRASHTHSRMAMRASHDHSQMGLILPVGLRPTQFGRKTRENIGTKRTDSLLFGKRRHVQFRHCFQESVLQLVTLWSKSKESVPSQQLSPSHPASNPAHAMVGL